MTISYLCTIQKLQGINLDKALISFNLDKQRAFQPGQLYAALSRITNLNGMYLIGSYCQAKMKSNGAAEREYERLREDQPFWPLLLSDIQQKTLTVTLLNTRLLKKHAKYIAATYLVETDVLCLTETQLQPGDST